MLRSIRKLALCCAFIGASSVAIATPITVDFDEITPGSYFENITSEGFRFSPSCHADINGWLGWDRSGCLSGFSNTDYLGQTPALGFSSVFIDYFDHPFTFTGFDKEGAGGLLTSSKGGAFSFSSPLSGHFSLDGPEWKGVKWIEFTYADPGAPAAHLDNLTFTAGLAAGALPEPPILALMGLGVLVLAARRRS